MVASPKNGATLSQTDISEHGNYFVSVYPPFSCWKKGEVPHVMSSLRESDGDSDATSFGVYVHVPFCSVRCLYCYYLSYANKSLEQMDEYVDALVLELQAYRQSTRFSDRNVSFVYFGGGTPSLLTATKIRRLLSEFKTCFPWNEVEEVTFECAPKTVTEQKLAVLHDAGVTRISLGVQQLDDEVLRTNGRVHLVRDVERANELIQRFQFEVVNLDLIVGLLGESERSFLDSLERTIRMNPDSVTIYQLEMPQNTPLYHLHTDNKLVCDPVSWPVKRTRLAQGFARLEEAGYQIRSAYAAGREPKSRQFVYQDAQYRGADLVGLGASAFSYVAGNHYQNLTSIERYVQAVNEGSLPIERAYVLSEEEQLVREFILQLKLGRIDGRYFRDKYGMDPFNMFSEPLLQFEKEGLLSFDGDQLQVTLEGLLQVDHLLPAFYLEDHQNARYA